MTRDHSHRIGEFIHCSGPGDAGYDAYLPKPLPPVPPLDLSKLLPLLERANVALGKLNGISGTLPDPNLFLYMYIRKEAVLSSQIEGTQSSFSDLLKHEVGAKINVPRDDVAEVSCYVEAITYGLERLKNLPLSLRLLKEVHSLLLNSTRGATKQPGEIRISQNWIGGSRPGNAVFVPPPPDRLADCITDLERFIHDEETGLPILIKAALVHVQFETIHPFLDGNGRLGRLLITLMLCSENILDAPVLYLSLYLKSRRNEYYDLLQSVREIGNWEDWIEFFLNGVKEIADQAFLTATRIQALFEEDRKNINSNLRATANVITVFDFLCKHTYATTSEITKGTPITLSTVLKALGILENIGIVREITGKPRNKVFVYDQYLAILNEGTEPL